MPICLLILLRPLCIFSLPEPPVINVIFIKYYNINTYMLKVTYVQIYTFDIPHLYIDYFSKFYTLI